MKKIAVLLLGAIVSVGSITTVGCRKQLAPLPTNAINSVDAQLNSILQAGHAAAVQYQGDVKAGFKPAPQFKAVMKTLIDALNIADPLYQSYHSALVANPSAPVPSDLSNAVAKVGSALGSLPSTVSK